MGESPMTKPLPDIVPLAYTIQQAARAIGRSPSRIKKAIKAGEMTARKDGRINLIEHSELTRWLGTRSVVNRAD